MSKMKKYHINYSFHQPGGRSGEGVMDINIEKVNPSNYKSWYVNTAELVKSSGNLQKDSSIVIRHWIEIGDALDQKTKTDPVRKVGKDSRGNNIFEGYTIRGNIIEYSLGIMGEVVYDEEHLCWALENDAGLTPLYKINNIVVQG